MSYRKLSAYLLAMHTPVVLAFQPLITDDTGTEQTLAVWHSSVKTHNWIIHEHREIVYK